MAARRHPELRRAPPLTSLTPASPGQAHRVVSQESARRRPETRGGLPRLAPRPGCVNCWFCGLALADGNGRPPRRWHQRRHGHGAGPPSRWPRCPVQAGQGVHPNALTCRWSGDPPEPPTAKALGRATPLGSRPVTVNLSRKVTGSWGPARRIRRWGRFVSDRSTSRSCPGKAVLCLIHDLFAQRCTNSSSG
jgi:hypothetical protein